MTPVMFGASVAFGWSFGSALATLDASWAIAACGAAMLHGFEWRRYFG